MTKFKDERLCSFCGKVVEIFHRKRMECNNVFCDKECEAAFRKKSPNTRCVVCGKPLAVKPYRLNRTVENGICCGKECDSKRRETMYLGENNPNSRIDYDFSDIYNLTHDGAYILGLIYSDGSLYDSTVSVYQNENHAGPLLNHIAERLTNNYANVSDSDKDTLGVKVLNLHSKELVSFVLNLGGIKKGKKSHMVDFPNIPEDKIWSFICGYFDGDGGFKYNFRYPCIKITSNSKIILQKIADVWKVNYTGKDSVSASGYKALDICGKMYKNVSFRHRKKYNYFLDILNWEPLPNGQWYKDQYFKCKRFSKDVLLPTKERVTDSGYDIYAIKFDYNKETDLYIADTGLAVEPIPGWYFDMIGRSSLPKIGFMFAGAVGVIDRSYVGPIKMLLKKIRKNAELPELPFKMAQLIPRRIIHAEFIEVESLTESDRGEGGFGSTGN